MEATSGGDSLARWSRALPGPQLWLPTTGALIAVATIGYGWSGAAGDRVGELAPFVAAWRPDVGMGALPAAGLIGAGLLLVPRLRSAQVRPWRFAAGALVLGLGLRLALGTVSGGVEGLYAVYEIGRPEASNEYLPALPAFELGTRFFLDRFAEVGTSLPVHAIGHPPGLLVAMHVLGIETAPTMAALTIGVGALSIPLTYLLARSLLDDGRARAATLIYVFAPSAILYGATSADALYVTLALAAAIPLALSVRESKRGRVGTLTLGASALAVASFFSYANLAIGAWAAFTAGKGAGLRRALTLAGACGAVLAAFYAALHLATGYDPIGTLEATHTVYREGIASRRPYEFWVVGSPVAFFVAAGLPVAWLALRAAAAGRAPAVALLLVVAIAALLGYTKAETERIYQFLIPLACVAAATVLPERWLVGVLALLGAQALAVELFLYTVW
jgi:hypothetical protein